MIDWSSFRPEKGCLLLSEPTLADPNFARTVVLLVAHNEEGSVGFVLNRSLELGLSDFSESFSGIEEKVYEGGPVELETLHYLHDLGEQIPGAERVMEGLYWGGDFELMMQVQRRGEGKVHSRYFLGYSGWAPGQLEAEMEEKTWLTIRVEASLIWDTPATRLWETCIRRLGGEAARLAGYPMDPRWN